MNCSYSLWHEASYNLEWISCYQPRTSFAFFLRFRFTPYELISQGFKNTYVFEFQVKALRNTYQSLLACIPMFLSVLLVNCNLLRTYLEHWHVHVLKYYQQCMKLLLDNNNTAPVWFIHKVGSVEIYTLTQLKLHVLNTFYLFLGTQKLLKTRSRHSPTFRWLSNELNQS